MTDKECDDLITKRLREYFDNRKRLSCIRNKLEEYKKIIEQCLDNPMHESLDNAPKIIADDVQELQNLSDTQSDLRAFLTKNGISELP
ncbi:MAG: hypothetical protein OXE84_05590 [Rhodobacteraceae bacterium]|nr:hypothetical protein [Paracoccaceae bacterium]MCY4196869.1 hypothetical protein [Paracoccaceae bacterium]MCY4326738.1 hypothetical protein [Paracoccaceae bacterium]